MRRVFRNSGNKYGAKKVEYDGITFDSMVEKDRYVYLKLLEKEGSIQNLRTHVTYELLPKQTTEKVVQLKTKQKIVSRTVFQNIEFTPDFVYEKNGELVAEDVKGSAMLISADFPLRRKLLYFKYGIYVNVVTYSKKRGWETH